MQAVQREARHAHWALVALELPQQRAAVHIKDLPPAARATNHATGPITRLPYILAAPELALTSAQAAPGARFNNIAFLAIQNEPRFKAGSRFRFVPVHPLTGKRV